MKRSRQRPPAVTSRLRPTARRSAPQQVEIGPWPTSQRSTSSWVFMTPTARSGASSPISCDERPVVGIVRCAISRTAHCDGGRRSIAPSPACRCPSGCCIATSSMRSKQQRRRGRSRASSPSDQRAWWYSSIGRRSSTARWTQNGSSTRSSSVRRLPVSLRRAVAPFVRCALRRVFSGRGLTRGLQR